MSLDEPVLTPRGSPSAFAGTELDPRGMANVDAVQISVDTGSSKRRSGSFRLKVHGKFEWHSLLGAASPCAWEGDFDTILNTKQLHKPLASSLVQPALNAYYASQHYSERNAVFKGKGKPAVPLDAVIVTVDGTTLDSGEYSKE